MDSANTMETQLYKDVFKGKHESVKKLLPEKADVLDGVTPRGNSVLHIAASRGHSEMVKLLLEVKPELITKKNDKGETPLHKAAAAGEQEIVEFLLASHEKVHDVESNGGSSQKLLTTDEETALHYAARGGHVQIVETLLWRVKGIERGKNKYGETALYIACDRGLSEVAGQLLKKNVSDDDYYVRNGGGTCLHVAVATEQEDLALELLGIRKELAEKADDFNNMPLHIATSHGLVGVVRELLMVAPQSSFRSNNEKMCPIHIAAQDGNVEIIKLLIKSVPQCIELHGKQHKNALHFALKNDKNWEVTKYLLENMPDVDLFINDRDDKGNTPLHMALRFANLQVLKVILSISRWKTNAVKTQIYGAAFKELEQRKIIAADHVFPNEITPSVKSTENETKIIAADHVSSNEITPPVKSTENETKIIAADHVSPNEITPPVKSSENETKTSGNDLKNDSAQTLSVIATLLATVSFAALFTIPGGVSSDSGIPILMHEAALKAFIIADTLAMCLSMLALMLLLDTHFVLLTIMEFNTIFGPIANSSKIFHQSRGLLLGRTFVAWAFDATMVSYATGLYVLVAPRCLCLAIFSCVTVLAVIFIWIFLSIRPLLKLMWTRMRSMYTLILYFTVPTLFREDWQ